MNLKTLAAFLAVVAGATTTGTIPPSVQTGLVIGGFVLAAVDHYVVMLIKAKSGGASPVSTAEKMAMQALQRMGIDPATLTQATPPKANVQTGEKA